MFCMIQSTQKIIKIGSSAGVTIPAKDLKRLGVSYGDELNISFEVAKKSDDSIMQDYAKFKKKYHKALKNLASR